jgi:hypothetical protein
VMTETLALRTRRLIDSDAVDGVFADL